MRILPGFMFITFRAFFFLRETTVLILIHFSLQKTISSRPFSHYTYSIKLKWSLGLSFHLFAISWSDKEMFVAFK